MIQGFQGLGCLKNPHFAKIWWGVGCVQTNTCKNVKRMHGFWKIPLVFKNPHFSMSLMTYCYVLNSIRSSRPYLSFKIHILPASDEELDVLKNTKFVMNIKRKHGIWEILLVFKNSHFFMSLKTHWFFYNNLWLSRSCLSFKIHGFPASDEELFVFKNPVFPRDAKRMHGLWEVLFVSKPH